MGLVLLQRRSEDVSHDALRPIILENCNLNMMVEIIVAHLYVNDDCCI